MCSNEKKLLEVDIKHNYTLIKEMLKHVVIPNDKQVGLDKSACDSQNHMVNPKRKNLTTQKISVISEILMNYPRMIKQIMELKKINL